MTFKFCAVHLTKEQFDWVIAKANQEGCLPSQVIGALIDQERATAAALVEGMKALFGP
jgi:hypothetical protein